MAGTLTDVLMRRLDPTQSPVRPQPAAMPQMGPVPPFGLGQRVQKVQVNPNEQFVPNQVIDDAKKQQDIKVPDRVNPTGGEGDQEAAPPSSGSGAGTGKSSKTMTERLQLRNAEVALDYLHGMRDEFRPEYTQSGFQLEQTWNNMRELLAGSKTGDLLGMKTLSPDEQKIQKAYSSWQSMEKDLQDVVLRLRSGGQTSEQEAQRMASGFLPNTGKEGFMRFMDMTRDGQTRYLAKLDTLLRMTNRAYMRDKYRLKNGWSVEETYQVMPLFDEGFDPNSPYWEGAAQDRMKELIQENPKITDDELRTTIRKEFGLQ